MWSEHGHKGSRFGLKLAHHGVYEATRWMCPQLPRLAHSWARAFVSRVKKVRHWALFADANKSQVNRPNIIENLSKASRLREYSSSSKDNLGKTSVSRGLGATIARNKTFVARK